MGVWIVTWDGPDASGRSRQEWELKANAEAHYARKLAAGLNPEIEGAGVAELDTTDDELAQLALEGQP